MIGNELAGHDRFVSHAENGLGLLRLEVGLIDEGNTFARARALPIRLGEREAFRSGGQVPGAAKIGDELAEQDAVRLPAQDGRVVQSTRCADARVLLGEFVPAEPVGDVITGGDGAEFGGDLGKERGANFADHLLRGERLELRDADRR